MNELKGHWAFGGHTPISICCWDWSWAWAEDETMDPWMQTCKGFLPEHHLPQPPPLVAVLHLLLHNLAVMQWQNTIVIHMVNIKPKKERRGTVWICVILFFSCKKGHCTCGPKVMWDLKATSFTDSNAAPFGEMHLILSCKLPLWKAELFCMKYIGFAWLHF